MVWPALYAVRLFPASHMCHCQSDFLQPCIDAEHWHVSADDFRGLHVLVHACRQLGTYYTARNTFVAGNTCCYSCSVYVLSVHTSGTVAHSGMYVVQCSS